MQRMLNTRWEWNTKTFWNFKRLHFHFELIYITFLDFILQILSETLKESVLLFLSLWQLLYNLMSLVRILSIFFKCTKGCFSLLKYMIPQGIGIFIYVAFTLKKLYQYESQPYEATAISDRIKIILITDCYKTLLRI